MEKDETDVECQLTCSTTKTTTTIIKKVTATTQKKQKQCNTVSLKLSVKVLWQWNENLFVFFTVI